MLGLLAAFALAVPLAQGELPANDGWVTDLAGMLSAGEERALESLMESYRAGTTNEIALLTVPSLEGRSLERFSLEVARGWGIGGKDVNNGALLLVAKAERKIRIEVGRGLEGTLTDSIAGRIIRDVIQPRFKRGEFPAGLREGVVAIHAAIGGDYGPIERTRGARRSSGGVVGLFIIVMIIALLVRRGRGLGVGRGHSSVLPWLILGSMGRHGHGGGSGGGGGGFGGGFGGGGGGFGGFGGGGGFSGGGASGGW